MQVEMYCEHKVHIVCRVVSLVQLCGFLLYLKRVKLERAGSFFLDESKERLMFFMLLVKYIIMKIY